MPHSRGLLREIAAGASSVLSEEMDNIPRLSEEISPIPATRDDEIISTTDAAKLLFISDRIP
jgi:hypothetical protein